jgi:hypothetical protein
LSLAAIVMLLDVSAWAGEFVAIEKNKPVVTPTRSPTTMPVALALRTSGFLRFRRSESKTTSQELPGFLGTV